jgi:hypothetical protein
MTPQICFFFSIGFSLVAWSIAARSIWPQLRNRPTVDVLRWVLMLHSFRFVGLSFLVPGVVSPNLPLMFAHAAAYGDLVAAILALLSLALLPGRAGIALAWAFNVWGTIDLLNAFYQAGHARLMPGQLGAAYFLPTFVVPLLLVTHWIAFRILWLHGEASVSQHRAAA